MDCEAATSKRLIVDVVTDGDDWRCLEGLNPAVLIAEITDVLPSFTSLPAPLITATTALSHDPQVQELNSAWRGQDKPTNVLSFPSPHDPSRTSGSEPLFIGDVILAEETMVREAADLGIAVADHFRHLVLHGILHLLGLDHETGAEAAHMEALETRILASLGVADPYADSVPVDLSRNEGARRA